MKKLRSLILSAAAFRGLPCGLALALLLAGCSPKQAEPEKAPPPPPSNRVEVEPESVLSARDAAMLTGGTGGKSALTNAADLAWEDLVKSMQPPSPPPEWQINEPSPKEIADFERTNSVLAAQAADKAKDFYTRFPEHEKAADARQQEYALLNMAVQMGQTNRLEQLGKLEEARLKDPNLSEDDRLELRLQQLQRTSAKGNETNMTATLAAMEKGARNLQKEFAKRPEVVGLLLSIAQGWLDNNQPDKAGRWLVNWRTPLPMKR